MTSPSPQSAHSKVDRQPQHPPPPPRSQHLQSQQLGQRGRQVGGYLEQQHHNLMTSLQLPRETPTARPLSLSAWWSEWSWCWLWWWSVSSPSGNVISSYQQLLQSEVS